MLGPATKMVVIVVGELNSSWTNSYVVPVHSVCKNIIWVWSYTTALRWGLVLCGTVWLSRSVLIIHKRILSVKAVLFSKTLVSMYQTTWNYSLQHHNICISTYLLTYLLTHSLTHSLTYSLTHSLTPWSRVLLEKLTVLQLVKKLPTFCGTRRFITAFTSACHLSLSWVK
jgi:hypothetical protein